MKTKKKSSTQKVKVTKFFDLTQKDFFLIAGPCVIENERMALNIASRLKEITRGLAVPFIFKGSYDKANRTSVNSFRGLGMKKGLDILRKVRREFGVPIITDVHTPEEAEIAGEIVDVLQIPAFLCRQTDLILAAAKTGKTVNIKKGQFLSPYEVGNIVTKAESTGSGNIMLTERGFSFGYNNLVVDLKSIAIMKKLGYPVIIDATHSVQRPGGAGDKSGGDREFVEAIAKGAVAAGANGVFLEVHHDVEHAMSDRETQYPLDKAKELIGELKNIFETVVK